MHNNIIVQFGPDIDYERVAKAHDVNMCNYAMLDCNIADAKSIYEKAKTGQPFSERELYSGALFFFNKKNGYADTGILLTDYGRWYFLEIRKKLFIKNGMKPNLKAFALLEERYLAQKKKIGTKGGK